MRAPPVLPLALALSLAACSLDPESACDDGKDNDRDGLFDCEDPDCVEACDTGGEDTGGQITDADGDGFDAVEHGGEDCDDGDASVHPDAEEVCNDGVDNDCSGGAEECRLGDAWLTDADTRIVGEDEQDRAGRSVALAGDVDGDGLDDVIVGAYGAENAAGAEAGSAYVLTAPFPTGDLPLPSATLIIRGESEEDDFGGEVTGIGDVNGDGHGDVMIGAFGCDTAGVDAGAAYLVLGGSEGELGAAEADAIYLGEDADDQMGRWFAGAEDFTGGGDLEVAIAAPLHDASNKDSDCGGVFFFDLSRRGELTTAQATTAILGADDEGRIGYSLATDDWDGDGLLDIAVSSRTSENGDGSGAAHVHFGPLATPYVFSDQADRAFHGSAGDNAGKLVAPGDMNGDGLGDLLVGAPYVDTTGEDAGASYLVAGPMEADGPLASTALATLYGEVAGDYSGMGNAPAGDLDADGHTDLLIGAPYASSVDTEAGAVYLVFGPVSGAASLPAGGAKLSGDEYRGHAGYQNAGLGDIDSDGYDDVLIGAYFSDSNGEDSGAAYLFLGSGI